MIKGCGIGCGLIIVLLVGMTMMLIWWDREGKYPAGQSAFPGAIKIEAVLDSRSVTGFREGCIGVAVRLTRESASEIETGGLSYLNRTARYRSGDSGALVETWQQLPPGQGGRDDFGLFRTSTEGRRVHLFNWCDNDNHHAPPFPQMSERGYFTTFNHGEGTLIVFPASRLAYYTYDG